MKKNTKKPAGPNYPGVLAGSTAWKIPDKPFVKDAVTKPSDPTEKPRLGLIPPGPIWEVGVVLELGARQYDEENWRKTPDLAPYVDALDRHLLQWKMGEDTDKKSGRPHLAHVMANVLFLLELEKLTPNARRKKRST